MSRLLETQGVERSGSEENSKYVYVVGYLIRLSIVLGKAMRECGSPRGASPSRRDSIADMLG